MKRLLLTALATAVLAGGALLSFPRQEEFPHERHARLFPNCESCHAGVVTGDPAAVYTITPADCANCHDGGELETVDWTGPTLEPDNLEFTHSGHASELEREGRPALGCQDCHQREEAEVRMAVERARSETCFECHAPEATEHYAMEVDCATCHAPLARAVELAPEAIAELPQPGSHSAADFLSAHGAVAVDPAANCAICHTRDSCERCHLNAAAVPAIAALEEDPRVATLVSTRPGEWPEPTSHQREDWAWTHEPDARADIETCANCHSASSCAACHGQGRPAIASRLPEGQAAGPTGVRIAAVVPVGHSETFFDRHGTAAAIGVPDCAACHAEKECIDCHDGVDRPGFHPVDFAVRHGGEAFSARTECAACHAREAFCRDCHSSLGLAAQRQVGGGAVFHDGQPDWLLAHGQAARQNMESCVGCHAERSCLRCHSARSGLRVSPHGPGFDPAHVADKSTQSCAICHFGLPEGISP